MERGGRDKHPLRSERCQTGSFPIEQEEKHVKNSVFRYIEPVKSVKASELVAHVYRQAKEDMGLVPDVPEPFAMHSPAPEILAGAWGLFRESLLAGRVRRGIKEAVATAVSEGNACPWCVDAHSIVLYATGNGATVKAVLRHDPNQVLDAEIQAVVWWASSTLSPAAPILADPPFSSQDAAEMIGTAVTFHYFNRMVNILLVRTNLPRNPLVKGAMKRTFGWLYTRSARKTHPAGAALALLPAAPLPTDLAWAESAPNVAGAFARFAAVLEEAGPVVLSPEVRALVHRHLQVWRGEDPGLSRKWVEQALGGLDPDAQTEGRLALLAAFATHQVDKGVIEAFRALHPTDGDLVGALAWSSFAAARRIGTWIACPGKC
jgi:AhpD family alkylhydroperoxidase